ncbi:MAG: hypothetical protein AB7S53_01925 [Thiomonas sp.]
MTDQTPIAPPIPVPGFLRIAPVKAWRSPAGIWFLRSEELQVGGILRLTSEPHESRWVLYTPCDADEWADILQGLANGLQSMLDQAMAATPAANKEPL